MSKINLLGMSSTRLKALLAEWGEPAFRATQLIKWIHQQGVVDFDAMTNVSKALKERLKQEAVIQLPTVVQHHISRDGTRKWLIEVDAGNCIEAVLIPEKGRNTLCISSQAGCTLDCSFCSTGKQGFNRDLTASEIIGQLWLASKDLHNFHTVRSEKVTNVVMMGMGEPLLNFDNVIDAVQLMMDDNAYGLSKRRVTISTAGVVPAIDKLADYVDASLAISLHAANDKLRDEIVPINRKYPIARLLESAKQYLAQMPDKKRRLTVEYTLIDRVNDSIEDAMQLADILQDTPCKINLIPFNPFSLSSYKRVSNNRLIKFQQVLVEAGYITNVRTTRGDDIDAACGQLAGKVNDKTKRNARHIENAQMIPALSF